MTNGQEVGPTGVPCAHWVLYPARTCLQAGRLGRTVIEAATSAWDRCSSRSDSSKWWRLLITDLPEQQRGAALGFLQPCPHPVGSEAHRAQGICARLFTTVIFVKHLNE